MPPCSQRIFLTVSALLKYPTHPSEQMSVSPSETWHHLLAMQDGMTPMLVLDWHVGLSKHKMATLALQVIIANSPPGFHFLPKHPPKERENEREGVGKEGNSFSEQQLHLKTTQEGNNTSSQGSMHQRELAFEVLCKIFTCFLLLTTGLMKKKEEKHVFFF